MTVLSELLYQAGDASVDPVHEARSFVGGIDCSPRRIGYCFMERDTEEILISGTQHVDSGDDLRHRRAAWKRITREYAEAGGHPHEIIAVGIEDAYMKFARVAIKTAMSIGNLEAFIMQDYSWALIELISASTWRSTLGLSSKGKEDPMLHAKTLKSYIEMQDEADAICIAQATSRRIVPF